MAESRDGRNTELRDVVEEFGRLLAIFEAQLGAAVVEADRECMAVGEAFHGLASARDDIVTAMRGRSDAGEVMGGCERIGLNLTAAVIALQYHDRLAQRVEHIRTGLQRLQGHLRDEATRSHEEWMQTLKQVEHRYYLEQKRLEAVAHAPNSVEKDRVAELEDNVELF